MKTNASIIIRLLLRIAWNNFMSRLLTVFSKLLRFGYRLRSRFKN